MADTKALDFRNQVADHIMEDGQHPPRRPEFIRPPTRWRSIGIVADGDAILIDGVSPWGREWEWLDSVQLPHPYYPNQIHNVGVHAVHADGRTMQFAAGELSNCVWGLWVREDSETTEASGSNEPSEP